MKRFLCLVIAILMILPSTVAMAAKQFIDVNENNSYSTAIYTLADFGIIKGDAGADTFRPKDGISREEFSVIMVRCLGLGDLKVDVTEYLFTDVTPETVDDWSINATKIAYDQGIIKGMGDGTFAPKADVTYEQAVKMIVCALGYEHLAIKQGGWPNGYISAARELGVTKRAEAPQEQAAPREIIAQLIYNALDVDLMTAYMDSDGVQRYSSTPGQTLLNQKLRLTESTGVITAVKNSSLGSDAIGVDADEVKIDFVTKFKIGETNADKYFGQRVTYFYKEDADAKTLVSVIPTDNTITELSSDNIKTLDNIKVEYYQDPDDTSVYKTLSVDSPAYLIYNGAYAPLTGPVTIETGSAKLIDNDSNGSVNVIIVDAAVTVMVDAVDKTNYIVYDAYDQGNKLELNPDSSDVINITKNGSKIEFSSIQKGDVLLVSQSSNATGSTTKNVKVITNTISGAITQLGSDYEEVVVGGKSYELSKKFINYIKKTPTFNFAIDNKVTCYLDDSNKIVAAKITTVAASSTFKYGYLIAAGVDQRSEAVEFRIHTQDNTTKTFTGTDKIKVNNHTFPYTDVVQELQDTSLTNKDTGFTTPASVNGIYYVPQLIKFSVNSTGKLDSIITMKTSGDVTTDLVISKVLNPSKAEKYNSSSSMFVDSKVSVNSNTKIFFIPTDRDPNNSANIYSVKTKSALKNGKSYYYEAYNTSATNTAEIVVAYGNSGITTVEEYDAPVVIVADDKRPAIANPNGSGSVIKFKCYENGEEKEYMTENTDILNGVKAGDVIRIQFNSANQVNAVKVMYAAGSLPSLSERTSYQNESDATVVHSSLDGKDLYNLKYLTVYGTVYSRDESNKLAISTYDIDNDGNLNSDKNVIITCNSSTKYFAYNSAKNLIEKQETINSIMDYINAKTGASKVFVHAPRGTAKFVLIMN